MDDAEIKSFLIKATASRVGNTYAESYVDKTTFNFNVWWVLNTAQYLLVGYTYVTWWRISMWASVQSTGVPYVLVLLIKK